MGLFFVFEWNYLEINSVKFLILRVIRFVLDCRISDLKCLFLNSKKMSSYPGFLPTVPNFIK